jgi:predicted acylesterase/phospholipase RssA
MANNKGGYIAKVEPAALDSAISKGLMDDGTRQLVQAELVEIQRWRERHDRPAATADNLTGLALSGGGIRSASFALGVLQALAHNDWLKRFDYLSTVSGGGYIGSALTWFANKHPLSANPFGTEAHDFPFGTVDPDGPELDRSKHYKLLRFLRQHGNYLVPGKCITLSSGIAVILRGLLLSLAVWLPIQMCLLALIDRPVAMLQALTPDDLRDGIAEWGQAVRDLAVQCALGLTHVYLGSGIIGIWKGLLILAIVAAIVFVFVSLAYCALTGQEIILTRNRYSLRRRYECGAGYLLFAILALAVLGSLPAVDGHVSGLIGGLAGIVSSGATVLPIFLRGDGGEGRIIPTPVLAVVGSVLLLYGLLLFAFVAQRYLCHHEGWLWWIVLVGILLGFLSDINLTSLHRYYRDRLMETFLPDCETAEKNNTGPAKSADSANLHKAWPVAKPPPSQLKRILNNCRDWLKKKFHRNPEAAADEQPRSPYPIFNTNIVLVDSADRKWRARGGDSFILTPLYCGSSATGWRRTESMVQGSLSLATAMAISGAAVDPNAAASGLARNRLVALLMNLFNLRLGYWVNNPKPPLFDSRFSRFGFRFWRWPNLFVPGLYEVGAAVGRGFREDRSFVHLADGGHFENLGIYELVRRRARVIVVSDGTADPTYSFADLRRALRLIEEDFGVTVDFGSDVSKMEPLMPQVDSNCNYPLGIRISKQGYIVGTIQYPVMNGEPIRGHLVYLTTTIVPKLSLRIMGYKGDNPLFPDQSTVDQFFDEDQFEAYRALGYRIAEEMIVSRAAWLDIDAL